MGVEFRRDMTLRLKNPEGLDRSATSTDISFFFRTDNPNGFLLYLGNEVGTKDQLRRTTSVRFWRHRVGVGQLMFVRLYAYPCQTYHLIFLFGLDLLD